MFQGWTNVFCFTFCQHRKEKMYVFSTVGLAVLLLILTFGINVYLGYSANKDKKETKIETVYLKNDTELDLAIPQSDKIKEVSKEISLKNTELLVQVSEDENRFLITGMLSGETLIKKKEAWQILDMVSEMIELAKCDLTGLNQMQTQLMLSPVAAQMVKAGEELESISEKLMKIIVPLVSCILMYVMIMLYGSSITKTIVAEKTSKLLETLLVSVKPYAVVAGKILAMTVLAISQIAIWVFSAVIGYVAGNAVNHMQYPKYRSEMEKVVEMISDGQQTLHISAVCMAVFALCTGFFMYCVIAGALASGVKKAEELSGAMSVFQIPVLLGYLAAYLLPLFGVEQLTTIARYVPFSAAYIIPADVLVGNISISGAAISVGIMAVTIVIAILFTGKIYKKKLF